MPSMYSRIVGEEVNSDLWSCTVIFILESSDEYATIPDCIQKMVVGGKRPALRNINPTTSPLREQTLTLEEIRKKIPWVASTEADSPPGTIMDLKSLAPDRSDRLAFLIKMHILETRAEMEKTLVTSGAAYKPKMDETKQKSSKSSSRKSKGSKGANARRQSRRPSKRKFGARKSVAGKSVAKKSVTRRSKQSGKGSQITDGENEKEEQEVHDEPKLGPHIYFIMTGFYDLDLVMKLVQLKVPVNAIIAIGIDPSSIKASKDEILAMNSKAKDTKVAGKKVDRKHLKRKSKRSGSRRKSNLPVGKSVAKKKSIGGSSKKSVSKKGSAQQKTSKSTTYSSEDFWKSLNFKLDQFEAPDELKDIAIIFLNPRELLNLEKLFARGEKAKQQGIETAEGTELKKSRKSVKVSADDTDIEELVYKFAVNAVYDIPKQMRNLAYYSKNITVTRVPKAIPISEREQEPSAKFSFVNKYHSLVDLIPQSMVTIEYILHCMVEQVISTVGSGSDTSLQDHIRSDINVENLVLNSKPPHIFHKDELRMKTVTLNVEGLDLPLIHYNIYKHMPYCKIGNTFQTYFVPNNIKYNNHFYKLWRSVDADTQMPYDLFHTYVNQVLLQKMYNFQQEPLLPGDRKEYETFVPIIPELSKFDPFAFNDNRFQTDAYKLKSFLECQEVLSLLNFPFHSSAVLAYNYIEEMDNYALLQNLQSSYSKFQHSHYLYYPPSDSLLVWFNDNINITELPTLKVRGVLNTAVGLRDYYKYVQHAEAMWLAYQKEAIESEDTILKSDYMKRLQETMKAKGYDKPKFSLTEDMLRTPLPENKIGNGSHKEAFDLGYSRIENEEKVTVFNSIDGTKITVKVCKWVRASNIDMIITVDSYDNSFTICRNIQDQFGEKGEDDSNIGLEVKTKHGDIISYRIKKQTQEETKLDEDATKGKTKKEGREKSTGSRKSLKRKSRSSKAGRKSSAGRKSKASRKSKAGRKSQAGRKSNVGRKSQAKRKSQSGKKGSLGKKEIDTDEPQEMLDYCFQVTSSTGLQSFFNENYGEKFIRQEYDRSINSIQAANEDYRLYLKDGAVLVYNTNGTINTLYPNGNYLKVYEVGKMSKIEYREVGAKMRKFREEGARKRADSKRKSTAGGSKKSRKSTAGGSTKSRKSSTGRRQSKRKSTASKRKSAAPRKSTARRQSRKSMSKKKSVSSFQQNKGKLRRKEKNEEEETVLEGEEITYYDIIQYDWTNFEGNETKFENPDTRTEYKQKYQLRAAEDQKGQLYVVRTDGSRILFEEDGTLRVQYTDGTAISSSPVIEIEDFYLNEKDKPGVSSATPDNQKMPSGKNEIFLPSSPTGARSSTDLSEQPSNLPFTVYKVIQEAEHPSYYRVQSQNGMLSMVLPGCTVVENPSNRSYNVYFGDSMAYQIEQRNANIYCRHPFEAPPNNFKDLIPKKSVRQKIPTDNKTTSGETGKVPPATLPTQRYTEVNIKLLELKGGGRFELLRATDSSGRTFRVFNDGSTEYAAPSMENNHPKLYDHRFTDFNKFFVINRDTSGYEFINLNEKTSEIYYPFEIITFYEKIRENANGCNVEGYLCKGLRPEGLKKKDLSRYLDFPKDRWLFHLAPFAAPCETHKDVEPPCFNRTPKAVVWGTRRRLRCPNFDVPLTLKKALDKYTFYQMRILKKYLMYLSIYETNYNEEAIELSHEQQLNMDELKLESKDEKIPLETNIDNEEGPKKEGGMAWGLAIRN